MTFDDAFSAQVAQEFGAMVLRAIAADVQARGLQNQVQALNAQVANLTPVVEKDPPPARTSTLPIGPAALAEPVVQGEA